MPEDPRITHPQPYQQGVDSANRLIGRRRANRMLFIRHAFELVTAHMVNWPSPQAGRPPAEMWARSAGFAHTLREYLEERSDV